MFRCKNRVALIVQKLKMCCAEFRFCVELIFFVQL